MYAESVGKQCWLPTKVDDFKKLAQAIKINPKDSIVKRGSSLWIVVQSRFKFRCPMIHIQL